jgi:hypothetical protein
MELSDLLEQLGLFGLSFLFVFGLFTAGKQLADTIQQLPLPRAYLNGVDGVISGDLLDRRSSYGH